MHVLALLSARLDYLAGPSSTFHTGCTGKRFGGYAREAWRTIASTRLNLPKDIMNHPIRHATTWMYIAIAACATPAFAQDIAPAAATGANGNGAAMQGPANRAAQNGNNNDVALLGAPADYGSDDTPQRSLGDAQRTAILDEQRVTMGGDGPAARPANVRIQRKAGGAMRVAGQPGRADAAASLTPEGASRNTYGDPYANKGAVYRSPW